MFPKFNTNFPLANALLFLINGSCTQKSTYSTLPVSKSVWSILRIIPPQRFLGFSNLPLAATSVGEFTKL